MDLGVVDQMMQAKQPLDMIIEKVTSSRRPFLLDVGELGLGNEDAEPSDQLYIVADGGRVCLVSSFRQCLIEVEADGGGVGS